MPPKKNERAAAPVADGVTATEEAKKLHPNAEIDPSTGEVNLEPKTDESTETPNENTGEKEPEKPQPAKAPKKEKNTPVDEPDNGLVRVFISSKVVEYSNIEKPGRKEKVKVTRGSINGQHFEIELDTGVDVTPQIAQVLEPLCKRTRELQAKEAV